jgi:diadenosine tetraphosphatase ApaH/serine/threonine PP2A family protein phosphatase
MTLTFLAYAYCVGERSSRGIERRCREDVAFRVVCAESGPRPRDDRPSSGPPPEALAGLFGQVLGLCAQAGLVRVGVIAVDGSKFRAAASDSAICSYEEIAAEILAEAAELDAAEDERFGRARGDELPEHLSTRGGGRTWLREAKQRLEAERAANPEPVPQGREERLEIGAVLDVDGLGPTLFCRGSPRDDEELLTALTPERRWRPALEGVAEEVVVCGHTHAQFDRQLGSWRVINAGSVGLPYEGRAGAHWLLLGPDVEHRRTD